MAKGQRGVIRAASGVTHGPDMKDKLPCVCSEGRTPLSRQKTPEKRFVSHLWLCSKVVVSCTPATIQSRRKQARDGLTHRRWQSVTGQAC